VVTAGHCTFGTGLNGEPTGSGSGGNDVWISFAEEPDYSILPPSSEFIPDDNEGRYEAWSTALNASDEWIRATAYPRSAGTPGGGPSCGWSTSVDDTNTLVAVVSFGTSTTCSGTSGAYRLDQADDLAFLATFGITP
jgi:hypothetical protein